jgi:hypothetical protein
MGTRFLNNLRKAFDNYEGKSMLGRWNLQHNEEIKATLANMDSCGDSLCGSPKEFKDSITNILKNEVVKNK